MVIAFHRQDNLAKATASLPSHVVCNMEDGSPSIPSDSQKYSSRPNDPLDVVPCSTALGETYDDGLPAFQPSQAGLGTYFIHILNFKCNSLSFCIPHVVFTFITMICAER